MIKSLGRSLAIMCLGWGLHLPLAHASLAQYSMSLDISASDLAFQSSANVKIKIRDPNIKIGACLYVPLEDPLLARTAKIHTLRAQDLRDRAARSYASLKWADSTQFEAKGAGYYQLKKIDSEGFLSLSYNLNLAGWLDRPGPLRFLSDFYPLVLATCPEPEKAALKIPQQIIDFKVQLKAPADWRQVIPGQLSEGVWHHVGSSFQIVLYQSGQVHETILNGSRLRFLYQSKEFLRLEEPVIQILQHHHELLGSWPNEDFVLVESDEFEPINSPGLIVVNRPQQALMRVLQEEILHWNIWQLTLMLAEQWFGFSAKAAGFDDIWLTQSLADSMGLLFLDRTSEYSNLFANLDKEDAYFNLRFRQTQDLIATGLSLMQPHNALVDDNLQSQSGIMDSSPFVFIRSSQAFRVLSQELGRDGYRHFLRLLLLAAKTKPLSPQLCYSILKSSGLPRAPELADLLLSYWQSDAWPDAKIDRIEAASEAKNTRVFIGSNSPLAVPLDVEVQATRGRRQTRHVQAGDYALGVEFTLPPEDITRVELDPGRDIYDSDRYNNSTEWPRISFFPGNARSLDDDGYTILWAPFLQKLPGHQLTLQLGWQMFRYMSSGLSGWLVYSPEDGRAGFRLGYQKKIPDYALALKLETAQDDDRTLPGERLTDFTIARRPILKQWPWLGLSHRQRLRQTLGFADAAHLTSTLGLNLQSTRQETCDESVTLEQERSSWVPHAAFRYVRTAGLMTLMCDWSFWQIRSRAFWGASERQGVVPGGALFNPQATDEARLRLDRPLLPLSGRILTLGIDLVFPARLSLPSAFFVLPRRTQFKIFADKAQLREPEHQAFASGLGLVLPIGGDVIGKQTVTFLEFSLLAVLHRQIDSLSDSRPGVLFDFSGRI